jgi:hypothetical protein
MNYKNDKLKIQIENSQYFNEIKEYDNYVSLMVGGLEKFRILENSNVEAYSNSSVVAWGNSSVVAWGNSSVVAWGNSSVVANDNSSVEAYDNSSVKAWENSSVKAYNNSSVVAWGNSSVVANDNSSVVAYSNSRVVANDNSSVVAKEFSSVYIKSIHTKISTDNHFGAIIKQVFKTTKKTVVYKKLRDEKIAVLELTKGQIFQSENHDKCRTEYAKVLRIESIDGKEQFQEGCPQHDESFKYIVGEVVKSTYDEKIKECSDGIHFFLTREKAERF